MGANAHLTMPLLASSSQRFVTGGKMSHFPSPGDAKDLVIKMEERDAVS